MIFLGPTAAQINAFGLKHEARSLAEDAGVPLLPGSGVLNDGAEALKFGEKTGYPVILKSSAGGGGIGCAWKTKQLLPAPLPASPSKRKPTSATQDCS